MRFRNKFLVHRYGSLAPTFRVPNPLCVYLLLFLIAFACPATRSAAQRPDETGATTGKLTTEPPNVVFILADDLGWSDLGCYGNTFHETPQIDRLAKQGARLTNAYSSAPVCSPYRASFLTGQHPARLGIIDYLRPNSANALPTTHLTLPKMFRNAGYATGMIGKWHLTGYNYHGAEHEVKPADHGFDFDVGREVKGVGNGANFWPYVFRDQPIRWLDFADNQLGDNEYLTDRINREAVCFIESQRDKPFFLYVSHYAPHTILNGRPDLVNKYRQKHRPGPSSRANCYLCEDAGLGKGDPGNHWATHHNPHLAAMIESIDQGVGMIMDKLTELDLAKNTIVVVTSDNGGESNVTSNAPFRGGKSELYEGGLRIPLVVHWPEHIQAGTVSSLPTQATDWYPTLLEAAQIRADSQQQLDGASILEVLKGKRATLDRSTLAWHYPLDRPHFLGGFSGGAIRDGDYKLIQRFETGALELYQLKDDPGESNNLAATLPAKTTQLASQLREWRDQVGARLPSSPLLTEPQQLYFAEHFHPHHLSQRIWYNADWKVIDGSLCRVPTGTDNTRVFLRDAKYRDSLIRFDFRLGDAKDVRLMTGSNGHYNTVLHLRPDHFFLQTAQDKSVPYFSYRHGECAFDFDPERWYSMTVEFIGDEAIAHLDHQHVIHAKHPIVDQERHYLAFQVDQHAAQFDNLQVFTAKASRGAGRALVNKARGRFKVPHSAEEQEKIRKSNAHEWHYQRTADYRDLVLQVEALDAKLKQRFPAAFRTHKEYKKNVQDRRKAALKNDPSYKEALFATHRAERAIDQWIMDQRPDLVELPSNRKKAAIEQARAKYVGNQELQLLVEASKQAQAKLEAAYPALFVTDDDINQTKKLEREKVQALPEFKRLIAERAEAYRQQQAFLAKHSAGDSESVAE